MGAYAIVTMDDPESQPLDIENNDNYDSSKAKEANIGKM